MHGTLPENSISLGRGRRCRLRAVSSVYQRLGGTGDGGLYLQTGDTVFQDQMRVSTVPWECMHVTCCKSINWRLIENGAGQVSKGQILLGLQSHEKEFELQEDGTGKLGRSFWPTCGESGRGAESPSWGSRSPAGGSDLG